MRVAILLPYVGEVPSYLGYVCLSMGLSKKATLLLFVGDKATVPRACEENVRVHRLDIAAQFRKRLGHDFGRLFEVAPSSLAEFIPVPKSSFNF